SGYHAVEPEIFNHYGTPDYYKFVKKAQSIFFTAIYIGALLLALFSQEVFIIMTSESFHEGYHLVPILIIGVVMSGQNVIYGGVLSSEKRTKVQGSVSIIGAALSFLFNLLLIPLWGTIAAALSRMISYVFMNTALFKKMTFPGKTIYKETIAVVLILVIPHMMFWLFPAVSLWGIIAKLFIALIYTVFVLKLFGISLVEMKRLLIKK
ncbi:MAG: polysaccharide biosynthesis C-terminal domain-containing protein, partial [Lachnospiraceae bacterium]|nr:polysaccharide biosynthesis C-terminal domain-containing protein [Lachnospiraceae bacterium]